MTEITLTEEQQRIIGHPYHPDKRECVAVKAFAGTGKTYTMQRLADHLLKRYPGCQILYIVFNKAMQQEAESKFPSAVKVSTAHSLAYRHCGAELRRMGKLEPDKSLNSHQIFNLFGWHQKTKEDWCKAELLKATVNNWFYSIDKEITEEHIPAAHLKRAINTSETTLLEAFKQARVHEARFLRDAMCNPQDPRVSSSHDAYLKLYQLSTHKLDYDFIFFDECQDANAAMLDMVRRSTKGTKVFIGDPHQQIYSFRGTTNFFHTLESEAVTYSLTESFRFGENTAEAASKILELFKGESAKLKGFASASTEIIKCTESMKADDDIALELYRSNVAIFMRALDLSESNVDFGFIGRPDEYLNDIEDIYRLYMMRSKDEFRNKFLASFTDLHHLAETADAIDDMYLKGLAHIGYEYRDSLQTRCNKIKMTYNKYNPAKRLSTGHKAKGLEADSVYVDGSFIGNYDEPMDAAKLLHGDLDEANLLYVALTRARKKLYLDNNIYSMLQAMAELDAAELKKRLKQHLVCETMDVSKFKQIIQKRMSLLQNDIDDTQ